MKSKRILEDNEVLIGYRISYLANSFIGPIYEEVAVRWGIARSEFIVVFCLRHCGELTAQDICDMTGRPKNSISQAVAKLEMNGYIKRRTDTEDKRRANLSLSKQGSTLYTEVIPLFTAREHQMLAPLTDGERAALNQLLAKLVLREDDWP